MNDPTRTIEFFLGRLEAKVDSLIILNEAQDKRQGAFESQISTATESLVSRVASLEGSRDKVRLITSGIAATIGFLASYIGDILSWLKTHLFH